MQQQGKFIHFVSDKNISPSIKDAERNNRSSQSSCLFLEEIGGSQTQPSNWGDFFRIYKFKNSLIQYLLKSWNDDSFGNILGENVLFANLGDTCYIYQVLNSKMTVSEFEPLYSTYDEADSSIIFHLVWCSTIPGISNVVIRTPDTDILITDAFHNLQEISIYG